MISREKPTAGNRFSLLFTVDNKPGKLAEVIEVIGASGFNMESIMQKRPITHIILVVCPTVCRGRILKRHIFIVKTCRKINSAHSVIHRKLFGIDRKILIKIGKIIV